VPAVQSWPGTALWQPPVDRARWASPIRAESSANGSGWPLSKSLSVTKSSATLGARRRQEDVQVVDIEPLAVHRSASFSVPATSWLLSS
jgi:hypothetical protein